MKSMLIKPILANTIVAAELPFKNCRRFNGGDFIGFWVSLGMDLRLHHSIYKNAKTKQIGFDGWLVK
jgi:hypothetical protein